jgi:neutral ceramidase
MEKEFIAGAAQVDITPSLGTIIGVDFLPHYTRFIHDPLYVKSIVFTDNKIKIAIIIVDICIMATEYMDKIKADIASQTDIPKEYILLASNHNHASGDVVGLLGGAADKSYRQKIPQLIVNSVIKANANLKPAKIGKGFVDVPEYVVCRRYIMHENYEAKNPVTHGRDTVKTNPFGAEHLIIKPAATPDPELGFLAIKDLDDKYIAILGNYSLHYAADWPEDSITADYFGEFANQLKAKLGAGTDFVGLMSNGTSGDVNIWDFMNPERLPKEDYAKTKLIGKTLAQKVVETLETIIWETSPELKFKSETLTCNVRKPSKEDYDDAAAAFILHDFNNLNLNKEVTQRIYDREQVLLNEYPDEMQVDVQALQIGSLHIGALPGEFFAETGLKIKASVEEKSYFSICLANSYGGYIPPAHEMDRGGYETWRARSSFMVRDTEQILRERIVELVRKNSNQDA